jgi:endonuclease III
MKANRRGHERHAVIRSIARRLEHAYGTPDLGNVDDPFGEVVFALLSTRTAPRNYLKAFAALRRRFNNWEQLAHVPPSRLVGTIRRCGLYRRKARALSRIARRVFVEDGHRNLDHLRGLTMSAAQEYLTSLPEVGAKVAKCVCLYSLKQPAFPLDVHNLRVLKRVGIVPARTDARRDAERVESLIPPSLRHSLHVNLVAHGRAICGSRPKCGECLIAAICAHGKGRAKLA